MAAAAIFENPDGNHASIRPCTSQCLLVYFDAGSFGQHSYEARLIGLLRQCSIQAV